MRLLVNALAEDERLVACGTAVDPAVRDVLRSLRPGSTVRKIPRSILQEYRQAPRRTEPFGVPEQPADGVAMDMAVPVPVQA